MEKGRWAFVWHTLLGELHLRRAATRVGCPLPAILVLGGIPELTRYRFRCVMLGQNKNERWYLVE